MHYLLLAMTLVVLGTGAGVADAAPNREAEAAVRKADLEMASALARRDKDAFLRFVDEESTFHGSRPLRGPGEIVQEWAPFFEEDGPTLTWKPGSVVVAESGDLGYSTGPYVRTSRNADGSIQTLTGTYVTIWRKRADGRWRVAVDIGAVDGPVAPQP